MNAMHSSVAHWDDPYSGDATATVEGIENFSARGMRRVYGRGDQYHQRAIFNMRIWRDRNNRLLVRFWSRNNEVDEESFEILGIPDAHLLTPFDQSWIPDCLRREYDNWIIANF